MTLTADTATTADPSAALDQIWYTRCPVPTASGLAFNLGWLADDFGTDGLTVCALQDAPPEIAKHHFDHQLVGLLREGGNVPAIASKSEGAPTRLIGLTWIDEWQSIIVRPDSGITSPEHLQGKKVAVPGWAASRGESFPRAMALHGVKNALATVGLSLDDVELVEVRREAAVPAGRRRTGPSAAIDSIGPPSWRWRRNRVDPEDRTEEAGAVKPPTGAQRRQSFWAGLEQLAAGELDAVYVKGASAADDARALGLEVGIDLDAFTDRGYRVNNGTPRPITVHERILAEQPDLVVRFLVQTLRAADWAASNLDEVRRILAAETYAELSGVETAYGDEFHRNLHPDLSDERLALLDVQKDFLYTHGFLAADVDIAAWADPEPLRAAAAIVAESTPATTPETRS